MNKKTIITILLALVLAPVCMEAQKKSKRVKTHLYWQHADNMNTLIETIDRLNK